MTAMELAKISSEIKLQGVGFAALKMPRPQFKRGYPNKMRTPFGLCRYTGHNDKEVVIFVTANQIDKLLKKLLQEEISRENTERTKGLE